MLTLPTGMQAKIDSAQQTLYNNAQPEIKLEIFALPNVEWARDTTTPPGVSVSYNDIAAVSANSIYVCGNNGRIIHWDGEDWELMTTPVGAGWTLTGICAWDDTHVFCCGYKYGPPHENCILRWDGETWYGDSFTCTTTFFGMPQFYDVWGADFDNVWVLGDLGVRMFFNGTTWVEDRAAYWNYSPGQSDVYQTRAVGITADRVWSVGGARYCWIFNGTTWTQRTITTDNWCFFNLSFISQDVGYVVGCNNLDNDDTGVFMTTDAGVSWTRMDIPEDMRVGDVNGDGGIFALATDCIYCASTVTNKIWGFNGFGWVEQAIDTSQFYPRQFWVLDRGTAWVVGNGVAKSSVVEGSVVDISNYVADGSTTVTRENPISELRLELENPAGYLVSETGTKLRAGQGLAVSFRAGSTEWFELGRYFSDRIDGDHLGPTVSVDCRNSIGKYLSDQPMPLGFLYDLDAVLGAWIADLMVESGIASEMMEVSEEAIPVAMSFPRDTSVYEAIGQLLTARPWWRMTERYDGVVVVGPPAGTAGEEYFEDKFPVVGEYAFERDTDIWSRKFTIDDNECYRWVCVQTAAEDISAELIGEGDGSNREFFLASTPIVAGSVVINVDGMPATIESIDHESGRVVLVDAPPTDRYEHNKVRVVSYTIKAPASGGGCPLRWQLHGSNDNFMTEKVVLDNRFEVLPWTGDKTFVVGVTGDYRWYSIEVFTSYGGTMPQILDVTYLNDEDEEIQPTMTSATEPEPYAVEASSEHHYPYVSPTEIWYGWYAFDGSDDTWWRPGAYTGWLKLDFGATLIAGAAQVTADYQSSNWVYAEVTPHEYLAVPANKTYFAEVPNETSKQDCENLAANLALQIGACGKVETFIGPIRPQLIPGDTATIDPGGNVGTVTTVKHGFGKQGFYTEFTVDSGDRAGIATMISMVNASIWKKTRDKATRFYSEE